MVPGGTYEIIDLGPDVTDDINDYKNEVIYQGFFSSEIRPELSDMNDTCNLEYVKIKTCARFGGHYTDKDKRASLLYSSRACQRIFRCVFLV